MQWRLGIKLELTIFFLFLQISRLNYETVYEPGLYDAEIMAYAKLRSFVQFQN